MEELQGVRELVIRQRGTVGEAITGWEKKNYYDVNAASGEQLLRAEEVGTDYSLGKELFEEHRSFQINLKTMGGGILLRCVRLSDPGQMLSTLMSGKIPYRAMEVYDAQNNHYGTIVQKFNVIRTVYEIKSPTGIELGVVRGMPLFAFSFTIQQRGRTVATIRKDFKNFLFEMFTKADSYRVEYQAVSDPTLKALILAAVFLIDFNLFESDD